MTTLEKIKNVITESEIKLIELDFRMNVDEYNSQKMSNYKTIQSMFEPMVIDILNQIPKRTHKMYGGSGMVLSSQILPALGLKTNHHILDKK